MLTLISGITNVATIHTDDLNSSYQGLVITPKVHSVGRGAGSGTMSSQDCRDVIRTFHCDRIAQMATKLDAIP